MKNYKVYFIAVLICLCIFGAYIFGEAYNFIYL